MFTARCTLQKGKFCIEPCNGGFLPSSTYVQGIPCLAGANTSTPAQSDPCIFAHPQQTPFQYPSKNLCLTRMITLVDLVKNYKTKTCLNAHLVANKLYNVWPVQAEELSWKLKSWQESGFLLISFLSYWVCLSAGQRKIEMNLMPIYSLMWHNECY